MIEKKDKMTPIKSRNIYQPSHLWHALSKMGLWRIYGNTASVALNKSYIQYGNHCRKQFGILEKQQQGLKEDWPLWKKDPLHVVQVIPEEEASILSEKISHGIKTNILKPLDSVPSMVLVPKLFDFLGMKILNIFDGKLGNILESLFLSHFRIEWATGYRNYPGPDQKSWLWHIDNDPPFVIKILLFLKDASYDSGATQYLTMEETMAFRKRGYFGVYENERVADLKPFAKKHDLEFNPKYFTAKAGDAYIFCANTLHRGGIIERDFRDALSFLILPSTTPWRTRLNQDGLEYVQTASGLPVDPFI